MLVNAIHSSSTLYQYWVSNSCLLGTKAQLSWKLSNSVLDKILKYIFPDKICDYFGVKIAIYFAYLGHYTKSLMLPAFLGLMLWFISGQDQVGVFLILLSLVQLYWRVIHAFLQRWNVFV